MLQDLPDELKINILSRLDISTFAKAGHINNNFWENSKSEYIWIQLIEKYFSKESVNTFKTRAENGRKFLEILKRSNRPQADIDMACAQIPTAKEYYQYLLLAYLGEYIRNTGFYHTDTKTLSEQESELLEGLRNWFDKRGQQNFRQISQDMEKFYQPVIDLLNAENVCGPFSRPSLYGAICYNQIIAAIILINHGAPLNAFAGDLLVEAAKKDDLRALAALLEKGLDPNTPETNLGHGWRPIMSPAYNNRKEPVRLLLKYGADPSMRDTRGLESAQSLAKNKQLDEMSQLLDEAVIVRNFRELPF